MSPELILPLLLVMMLVFMFFQFRKQKKQMNETLALQQSLTVGTEVMTSTGLFGTVVALDGDEINLEIAPGVTTTWLRRAIVTVVTPEELDAPSIESVTDEVTDAGTVELDKRPDGQ